MSAREVSEYNYTVAIVGNPNSGKTTLFNLLTGANQRVGNWPGVTVEKKEGTFQCGNRVVNLVDLPGIYSVSATSEDERVARDYLLSGESRSCESISWMHRISRGTCTSPSSSSKWDFPSSWILNDDGHCRGIGDPNSIWSIFPSIVQLPLIG